MAKVHIPLGYTWQEVADQLKTIGITLDGHQLPDGKSSMKAYLWSLELASYDAAHA